MDNRYLPSDPMPDAPPRPSPSQLRQLIPRRRRRLVPYILVSIIVVALIGGGVYFWQRNKSTTTDSNDTAATTETDTPATTTFNTLKPTTESEAFKSADRSTTITHPKTWNASEADGTITISSPTVLLPGPGSEQRSGQVILTIQPKQTTLPKFTDGGATAVRDSEKLTYATPSAAQRAQTYLSFLHYASSTSTATMFDGMYVTGDFGYTANQYVPESDIVLANPLVSISFLGCADTVCSNPSPLAVPASAWDDADFSGAIRPILTSLIVN